jgi:O-antigen ligase
MLSLSHLQMRNNRISSFFILQRGKIGFFILCVVTGIIIGKMSLQYQIQSVFLTIGCFGFFVLKRKPEIGILVIVILISSIIFTESLPILPIGIGSLHISDIILFLLLFLPFYDYLIAGRRYIIFRSLDLPLLFFFVTCILAALASVLLHDVPVERVVRNFRFFTYYLLFFSIMNHVRTLKQVRFLVNALFCVGTVVGIAMLAQSILGESVRLMPGRLESTVTIDAFHMATRILPPGQSLVFLLFVTSVIFMSLSKIASSKPWHYLVLFSSGIGVILTYNRSFWAGSILCFFIFFLFCKSSARRRMLVSALLWLLIVTIFLFTLLLFDTKGRVADTTSAIEHRFKSLFTGDKLYQSGSLEYRKLENRYAFARIKKNIFLGNGLANDYRPPIFGSHDYNTYYIHNGYLFIFLQVGLIGFVPLLWFFSSFLIRTFKNLKHIEDDYYRSLITGFAYSVIGVLIINITIPMFRQWFSIVAIVTVIGLTESIFRICEQEGQGCLAR